MPVLHERNGLSVEVSHDSIQSYHSNGPKALRGDGRSLWLGSGGPIKTKCWEFPGGWEKGLLFLICMFPLEGNTYATPTLCSFFHCVNLERSERIFPIRLDREKSIADESKNSALGNMGGDPACDRGY